MYRNCVNGWSGVALHDATRYDRREELSTKLGCTFFYYFFSDTRDSDCTRTRHITQLVKVICGFHDPRSDVVSKAIRFLLFGAPFYIISLPLFLVWNMIRCSGPIFFGCGVIHTALFMTIPSFYYSAMWWTGVVSPIGVMVVMGALNEPTSSGKGK